MENVLLSSVRAVAAGLCLASRVVLARLLVAPVDTRPDLMRGQVQGLGAGRGVGPAGCNGRWVIAGGGCRASHAAVGDLTGACPFCRCMGASDVVCTLLYHLAKNGSPAELGQRWRRKRKPCCSWVKMAAPSLTPAPS